METDPRIRAAQAQADQVRRAVEREPVPCDPRRYHRKITPLPAYLTQAEIRALVNRDHD